MNAYPTASTSRLWVFNPGHEEALSFSREKRYTLSKEIRWMRHELSPLLRLLASGEDLIYAPASPDGIPARLLNAEGDDLPAGCDLPAELSVVLWGLDDHIVRELRECPLFLATTLLFPPITPSYLRLSHRRASYDLLAYLVSELGYPSDLLPRWIEAGVDKSDTELRLRAAIEGIKSRPLGDPTRVLIKRPYSSSGRGVFPLPLPLQEKHLEALVGSCTRSGSVSIEPYLEVVDNWALEYTRSESGEVSFFALSHFDTLPSGRAYLGNILTSPEDLWERLTSLMSEEALLALINAQCTWLEEELSDSQYTGYIGIDLFFYRDGERLRLHPCVEINLRTTMGVLAHFAYEQYVPDGRKGVFRLERGPRQQPSQSIIPLLLTSSEAHFSAYIELEK